MPGQKISAPSDVDYFSASEGYIRMVELTCADCGEPFEVPYVDGPPLGRPLCEPCKFEIEEKQRRLRLLAWAKKERYGG